jgi:hypothetical protein
MAKNKTLKRLTPKKLDSLINDLYTSNCSGVQIPLLDITRVFRAGRDAYNYAYDAYLTINTVAGSVPVAVEEAELLIRERVRKAIVEFVETIRTN